MGKDQGFDGISHCIGLQEEWAPKPCGHLIVKSDEIMAVSVWAVSITLTNNT